MTTTPDFPGEDPAVTGTLQEAARMTSVPREFRDDLTDADTQALAEAAQAWGIAERAATQAAQEHLDERGLQPHDEHWPREHAEWMHQQDEYEQWRDVALHQTAFAASLVSSGRGASRSRTAAARAFRQVPYSRGLTR